MNTELFDLFSDKEKAIHQALWLNFKYRIAGIKFGITEGPEKGYAVMEEALRDDMELTFIETPSNYLKLSFDEIRHIRMDKNPLPNWEELCGTFATMDGELLRFILETKLPLEKLIRYELAIRGFDKNHSWVGFEESEKIWLENEQ
jgi:hypothetical protein